MLGGLFGAIEPSKQTNMMISYGYCVNVVEGENVKKIYKYFN